MIVYALEDVKKKVDANTGTRSKVACPVGSGADFLIGWAKPSLIELPSNHRTVFETRREAAGAMTPLWSESDVFRSSRVGTAGIGL